MALFVVLKTGDRLAALDVSAALHVREAARHVPVPGSPSHILGVSNVDGQLMPVVDLGRVLGVQPTTEPSHFCLVQTQSGPIALAVDDVLEIASVDEESLRPESTRCGVIASALARLHHWRDEPADEIVVVIDPDRIAEAA